jgi:hypothetical protein
MRAPPDHPSGNAAEPNNTPKPLGELARIGLGISIVITAIAGYGLALILFLLFWPVASWAVSLPWYGAIPVLWIAFWLLVGGALFFYAETADAIHADMRRIKGEKP